MPSYFSLVLSVLTWLGAGCGVAFAHSNPARHAEFHFQGALVTTTTLQATVHSPPTTPDPPAITPPPPEAQSCASGQIWDPQQQRCINPCASYFTMSWHPTLQACVRRTSYEYENESESCGKGNEVTGRSRYRSVYQARLIDGTELVLYGPWSAWSAWSTCRPGLPTPTVDEPGAPTPGKQYTIKALICGPNDEGYDSVLGPDWAKNRVIQYYRNFGSSRRCPEAGGFQHWLQNWHDWAVTWVRTHGMWHDYALEKTWSGIKYEMDQRATVHQEYDPPLGDGGVAASHLLCLAAAQARWPQFSGTVSYIIGSGNRCRVNTL